MRVFIQKITKGATSLVRNKEVHIEESSQIISGTEPRVRGLL